MKADFARDVSVGALFLLPFLGVFLALDLLTARSEAQLLASDPLVQLLEATSGLWLVPVLCVAPAVLGWRLASPSREALLRGLREAGLAGVIVVVGLPLLRWIVGPSLPDFIPPEESAGPGIVLGLGAGMVEEAVFRFGLLAPAFLWLRPRLGVVRASSLATLATGLLFALAHELGPGAGSLEVRFFVTRFVIPGCLMSVLFLRVGPSFLVTLHCGAHLGIPLLFAGAS